MGCSTSLLKPSPHGCLIACVGLDSQDTSHIDLEHQVSILEELHPSNPLYLGAFFSSTPSLEALYSFSDSVTDDYSLSCDGIDSRNPPQILSKKYEKYEKR